MAMESMFDSHLEALYTKFEQLKQLQMERSKNRPLGGQPLDKPLPPSVGAPRLSLIDQGGRCQ